MKRRWVLCLLLVAALGTGGGLIYLCRNQLVESWHLAKLDSPHAPVREKARAGLVKLLSVYAVPRLLQSEHESDVSAAAARQITAAIGVESMGRLGRVLLEEPPELFISVIVIIVSQARPDDVLAAILRPALQSSRVGLRRYAAEELSRLGPAAAVARRELEDAARSLDPDLRFWAELALVAIDGDAKVIEKWLLKRPAPMRTDVQVPFIEPEVDPSDLSIQRRDGGQDNDDQ